jgi:hypothetical protein
MARMQWKTDRNSERSEAGYRIAACVEGSATLYVLIGGPPPKHDPPVFMETKALMPSGELVRWRGQGSTGDKEDDLIIAKFDKPYAVDCLDIRLESDGRLILAARVVAHPDEDQGE